MNNPVCPSCGAGLPSMEADHCERCGAKVIPVPGGRDEARERRVIWLAVGVFVLFIGSLLVSAVIAAFIFGMAGSVERTKAVAATARQSGQEIYVTWQGGRDNDLVASYSIILEGMQVGDGYPPLVGNTTRAGGGTPGQDHVVVMASFTDGSGQVVLDTYV